MTNVDFLSGTIFGDGFKDSAEVSQCLDIVKSTSSFCDPWAHCRHQFNESLSQAHLHLLDCPEDKQQPCTDIFDCLRQVVGNHYSTGFITQEGKVWDDELIPVRYEAPQPYSLKGYFSFKRLSSDTAQCCTIEADHRWLAGRICNMGNSYYAYTYENHRTDTATIISAQTLAPAATWIWKHDIDAICTELPDKIPRPWFELGFIPKQLGRDETFFLGRNPWLNNSNIFTCVPGQCYAFSPTKSFRCQFTGLELFLVMYLSNNCVPSSKSEEVYKAHDGAYISSLYPKINDTLLYYSQIATTIRPKETIDRNVNLGTDFGVLLGVSDNSTGCNTQTPLYIVGGGDKRFGVMSELSNVRHQADFHGVEKGRLYTVIAPHNNRITIIDFLKPYPAVAETKLLELMLKRNECVCSTSRCYMIRGFVDFSEIDNEENAPIHGKEHRIIETVISTNKTCASNVVTENTTVGDDGDYRVVHSTATATSMTRFQTIITSYYSERWVMNKLRFGDNYPGLRLVQITRESEEVTVIDVPTDQHPRPSHSGSATPHDDDDGDYWIPPQALPVVVASGGGSLAFALGISSVFIRRKRMRERAAANELKGMVDVQAMHKRPKVIKLIAQAQMAIQNLDTDMLENILRSMCESDVSYAAPRTGMTMLHMAVVEDSEDMVELLIEYGAQVNAVDTKMQTSLLLACMGSSKRIPKMLLESGASQRLATTSGETPLMTSITHGHRTATTALLAELVALDKSAKSDNLKVRSRSLLYKVDNGGRNILHWFAATGGDGDMYTLITILNLGLGSPVEFVDVRETRFGRTPLMLAILECNIEVVGVLLRYCASTTITDNYGKTATILASRDPEVAQLMERHRRQTPPLSTSPSCYSPRSPVSSTEPALSASSPSQGITSAAIFPASPPP